MNRSNHLTTIRRTAGALFATCLLASCGVADTASADVSSAATATKPPSHTMRAAAGDLRLELPIANPYTIPIGAFTTTDGADLLGCSTGRFADGSEQDGVISTTLTCESGARHGTFVLSFEPQPAAYTANPEKPEHVAGPWTIHSGTDDYELLTGSGTMVGAGVFPFHGVERWFTGTISFDATE